MPSHGSQPPALQKWRPTPILLVASPAGSEGAQKTVAFRVPIPDSRLNVKISLLFVFAAGAMPEDPGTVDLSAGAANIWLSETEDDETGTSGITIPCTNIEGSEAAPTNIPFAIGLAGYSREFHTTADNIEGVFKTAANGFQGNWVLQLRYQPTTGQRYTPEEWDAICGLAKPIRVGAAQSVLI